MGDQATPDNSGKSHATPMLRDAYAHATQYTTYPITIDNTRDAGHHAPARGFTRELPLATTR